MRPEKRIFVFLLGTLVLLWALACGGSSATPVAMGDVPVYSGAAPVERGGNVMVDAIVESLEESAGDMASEGGATIETDLYSLPAGATWADVKGFYNAELGDTDWEPEPEFTDESEAFSSVGWTRGSGANEQALLVMYVADPLEGGAFLVTMLLSE
jgi:hypothetical protein